MIHYHDLKYRNGSITPYNQPTGVWTPLQHRNMFDRCDRMKLAPDGTSSACGTWERWNHSLPVLQRCGTNKCIKRKMHEKTSDIDLGLGWARKPNWKKTKQGLGLQGGKETYTRKRLHTWMHFHHHLLRLKCRFDRTLCTCFNGFNTP